MQKIIALDIDGTLLNGARQITPAVRTAVQHAQAMGVFIVLASARPYCSICPLADELGLIDTPIIAAGGSDVRQYPTGKLLYQASLSPKEVKACAEFCHRHNQYFQAFLHDGSYFFETRTAFSNRYAYNFRYEGTQADFCNWNHADCCKVMVICELEQIDAIYKLAQAEMSEQFLVSKVWSNIMEFHSLRGGKGRALRAAAESYFFLPEEVIAVGDDTVDTSMLEYAGLGVAMGNACKELKAVANYIAPSNNENGVAHVIQKFILGPNKP